MNFGYEDTYYRPYHKLVRGVHDQNSYNNYDFYRGYGRQESSPESPARKQHRFRNCSHSHSKSTRYVRPDYERKDFMGTRNFGQPVWEQLYEEGLQAMKQRNQEAEEQKVEIDIECTFKPMIKKSKRYLIPSNSTFLERNQIWQDNKIEKIVKEKEEVISKNLKNCTFKPSINNRSTSLLRTGQIRLDEHSSGERFNRHSNGLGRSHHQSENTGNRKSIRKLKEIRIDDNIADEDYNDYQPDAEKRSRFMYHHKDDPNTREREEFRRQAAQKKGDRSKPMEMVKVRNIIRSQLNKIQL